MSANTETTVGPPRGYVECPKKCGRWKANKGQLMCWRCFLPNASAEALAVYDKANCGDWTPPTAAPAAYVERRKVEVGQRRRNQQGTFTVYAIEDHRAIVCQAGQVDPTNGYVHKGSDDCCWEFVSMLEDCELLADAPPEPAKPTGCCDVNDAGYACSCLPMKVVAKSPPAQEAPKAAPVCGNNDCKTPTQNVAQRWSPRFDNSGTKTGVDLEWSCEPCHLLDEEEFFEPTTHTPYAGPERLPRPQLAVDWVDDCLPESGR